MNRIEKSRVIFSLPEYFKEDSVEMDQESNGSSAEDGESPRSVANLVLDKRWKSIKGHYAAAHGQIMRIRAEDLHLAEDIAEGPLFFKDKFGLAHYAVLSRPILPSSPLKTAY